MAGELEGIPKPGLINPGDNVAAAPAPKPKAKGRGGRPKMGRPTAYTVEVADRICAELAEGKSLRTTLELKGMPAMSTVFLWLRTLDDFSEQYARAKAESADALADDITDIADKTLKGTYDPQSARVAMDGKKWVASKLKPKVYGDKLDLTTGNEKLNRGMSDAELEAILKRERSTADKAGKSSKA